MIRKDDLYDNPYYKKFLVEKNKIKERYPKEVFQIYETPHKQVKNTKEHQIMYREYLKELGDLMYKPDGLYQKFVWDTMSDSDKALMEAKASANFYGRKDNFNYY